MKAASGAVAGRRPRRCRYHLFLLFMATLLASCQSGGGSEDLPPATYTLRPEATWTTGPLRWDALGCPMEWMLPSGQRITPYAAPGSRLFLIDLAMPLGLAVHPAGKHLFVSTSGGGDKALVVVDIASGQVIHRIVERGYFLGLAFRPPGWEEVYVSMPGRDVIETYDFDHETGDLTHLPDRSMALSGFAGDLCVTPDGRFLLALSQFSGWLTIFDLDGARPQPVGEIWVGSRPYALALHPSDCVAYVSCEAANEVAAFDISEPTRIRRMGTVKVQKNPEALLVGEEGARLYVTNSDDDSLSILDIGSRVPSLLRTVDLRGTPEYGSGPNALAFSQARSRLYVAHARLNKLTVLNPETGAHLGEIPTAYYPTAVALHSDPARGGDAAETLVVLNGKGIGTPWEGEMRNVPGAISVIPVPADEDLAGLTDTVAENNAFPGRLFDLGEGALDNPVPRSRGGPTPIEHVFIVVRENKTYDYLLGPYRPGEGEARGDADLVMDDYEQLLPNLYGLAERFSICDNYYCNAEASSQGHEMLTSTTANTYVEKLVRARNRPIEFEIEMVVHPVAWPKKDFIFQHAMRHGVSFRNYGEAVGAGRDFLMFNEDYVHQGPIDPPWYNMFSKDMEKMDVRIAEWESERFSGENFPSLIFMLLPNDHTFGGDPFLPTYESMVSDNDEATGYFVEWLSKSPYWMSSVAFITEDDPQQGYDHIDPHRTLMMVVSPWVRRGYVSPVRYNEAHLYATVEYLLGLPPMTIFDEAAQPMYDLFTFSADDEPYTHMERMWPEEFNPVGTSGARRCADMYFAEPDQTEGLLDAHLEMVAERKEARQITRRIKERAARLWGEVRSVRISDQRSADEGDALSPARVLDALVDLAEAGERRAFQGLLDEEHGALCAEYLRRRDFIHATSVAQDPIEETMRQFRDLRPRAVSESLDGDRALVEAVYKDGLSAELHFRREPDGWKFDLSHHIGPAVRILGDTFRVKQEHLNMRSESAH